MNAFFNVAFKVAHTYVAGYPLGRELAPVDAPCLAESTQRNDIQTIYLSKFMPDLCW